MGFCSILGILSLQRSLLSSRTYARSLAAIGGFGASALSPPAVEEPTSNGKNRGRNRRKRGRRASETPSPTWFFAKEKTVTFSGPEEIDMDSASVLACSLSPLISGRRGAAVHTKD